MANKNENQNIPFDLPLNGKLITSVDPLLLGEGDFRQLTNLRYSDKSPVGVKGMTKITATTLSGDVDDGFFFRKDQPSETHTFIKLFVPESFLYVYKSDNTNSIPGQDTFSEFQLLGSFDSDPTTVEQPIPLKVFSMAPDNAMMILTGANNYIWGGNESRMVKFLNYNADQKSIIYDYTEQVSNALTDAKNIATMHLTTGGLDANVMLLLHLDNNVTDSKISGPHTVTNNNVVFSSTIKVFGTHSAMFATNAYLTVPDSSDFDFSAGIWSLDCRLRTANLSTIIILYYQNSGADADSISCRVNTDGSVQLLIQAGGIAVVSLSTPAGVIAANTWYKIQITEDGDSYYIFVDGILWAYTTDTSRAADYTQVVYIGGVAGGPYFSGYLDEYRISNIARQGNIPPSLVAYGTGSKAYVSVHSLRALKGVKFYIATANTTGSSMSCYYWNGSALVAVSGLVDGTASSGKTLAKTGEISFTSTVGYAKLRYINDALGYYYVFVFDSVDATTTVYYSTADAPVQNLTDIWDGTQRSILSFYKYTTTYSDLIVNVSQQEYVADSALTYAQIGGLTAGQKLYLGFSDRLMGLSFILPDATYVNTTANTVMTVKYYNGQSFVTVGSIQDGTQQNNVSMYLSGTVTWVAPEENTEFQTNISNSDPWYFYEITFSQNLAADVRIDFITGIPAPKSLRPYRTGIEWQNRLWLFDDYYQRKNSGKASQFGTNCVFNGDDSIDFEFGGPDEVVGAATLFTRFGSSIYDNLIVFKRNSVYLLDGYSVDTFRRYTISNSIGCISPGTIQTCDIGYDVASGVMKHVVIWRSARGIEMFDGSTLTPISGDIENIFTPSDDNAVYSQASYENSFVDAVNNEYHWLYRDKNLVHREKVYDLKRKKWFDIDRGSYKLTCGFSVYDPSGNQYCYGGSTSTGGLGYYIQRLENGTDFNGSDIVHTMWLGDLPLSGTNRNASLNYEKCLRQLQLTAKSKNISTATVTPTVYVDGGLTGTTLLAISQVNSTKRFYRTTRSCAINGTTHGFKFVVTTDNENIGFEPLMVSGFYQIVREN